MKTTVIMERELMGVMVRQESSSLMFSANDFHAVANLHREEQGLTTKQMGSYFILDSTTELMDAMCIDENLKIEDLKKTKRGKYGGTWLHPILFLDMAMWYSPRLRHKVLAWVIDGLIDSRCESGDSYKEAMSALTREFYAESKKPVFFIAIARQIAAACRVGTDKDKWQKASKEQLDLRISIHENIALIADMTPNAGTCVSTSIDKAVEKARAKLTKENT